MKRLNLVVVVGCCVALVPAMTLAGNGQTGACFVFDAEPVWPASGAVAPDGGFELGGCADGFTQQECESVSVLVDFAGGATCADVAAKAGITWQGSCDATIPPVGDVCVELWTFLGGKATGALCINDIGGSYAPGVACAGGPVPTIPGIGLAAMALLMLAGALFFLAKRSPHPSI